MKTIIKQNDFTVKYLGKQAVLTEKKYHLSKFCVTVPHNDGLLLYNTLTRRLSLLNTSEIGSIGFEKSLSAEDICQSELIEGWDFIADGINEFNLAEQIKFIAKQTKKSSPIKTFTIFPTTDCNARCFYCFELGCKRENMSEKTAADTAEYIKRVSAGHKIKLLWFGGEPLYNSRVIDIICDKLNDYGVEYWSHITTNGYLFDTDTVKKAKDLWKLRNVQLTFDGTQDIYNKTKAFIYKNDVNPFSRVYANLGLLLKNQISVTIRYNMDTHNVSDLYSLTDMIKRDYGQYDKYLKIMPDLLFEDIGADKRHRNEAQREAAYSELFKFYDYLTENNLYKVPILTDRSLITHHCMADDDQSVTITPDGHLGLCEHYYNSELSGSIYSDEKDEQTIKAWKEEQPRIPECENCFYFPMCIRIAKCPTIENRACNKYERKQKRFFLEQSIKASYEYFLKNE